MPRGVPKNAKSLWPLDEASARYESLAALARAACPGRLRSHALVEIGRASAPDTEIMEHARRHDCVILTHDLDFSAILAATQGNKPSVIQLRTPDIRPEALADEVIAALNQLRLELEAGALITVTSTKRRLRILPLQNR